MFHCYRRPPRGPLRYFLLRDQVQSLGVALQRLDVSRALGHQVTGAGVLADLFTELLVIARCGVAFRNDGTIL